MRAPPAAIIAAALAVVAMACRHRSNAATSAAGGAPADSPVGGATGKATITWQPAVRTLPHDAGLAALRGASHDGSTYLFDPGYAPAAALHPGDILLLEGVLARKVVLAERVGDDLALLTEPVGLGELVKEGRVTLDAPVRFRRGQRQGALRPTAGVGGNFAALVTPSDAWAQSPSEVRAKERGYEKGRSEGDKKVLEGAVKGIFSGWTTTFSADPGDNRLDIKLSLTKDVGGFRALVSGDGYLADFDLSGDIEVHDGIVDKLEVIHRRLNGTMNFKWEVAKDTPGAQSGNDRIKLPAALSVPLWRLVGGLPLYLEVSSALIIKPAISGGKEYSRGAFRITYDGTQGFKAKQGNIDTDGNVSGDIKLLETQNISSLAPLGMVVAFAAPRIELTLGTSKLFKGEDMADAAEKADMIAETLIKKAWGEEGLQKLHDRVGDFSMKKVAENALRSDAAGFVEIITSTGMSHTGMSAIVPCTRTDIHLMVKVGASVQAFGQDVGKVGTEIFKKDYENVNPPGTRLCEAAKG